MRFRRRCRYQNCYHFSNDNVSSCRFHKFPVDRVVRWLRLCGSETLTPKKVNPSTYICSCHFVGGKGPSKNNPDPIEYIEEFWLPDIDFHGNTVQEEVCKTDTLCSVSFQGTPQECMIFKNQTEEEVLGTACATSHNTTPENHHCSLSPNDPALEALSPFLQATPRTQKAVEGLLGLSAGNNDAGSEVPTKFTSKRMGSGNIFTSTPAKKQFSSRMNISSESSQLLDQKSAISVIHASSKLNLKRKGMESTFDSTPAKRRLTLSPRNAIKASHLLVRTQSPPKRGYLTKVSPWKERAAAKRNAGRLRRLAMESWLEDDYGDRDEPLAVPLDQSKNSSSPRNEGAPSNRPSSTRLRNLPSESVYLGEAEGYKDDFCIEIQRNISNTMKIRDIGIQCSRSFICYEKCKNMKDFKFYTGLTPQTFEILYTFLGGDRVCSKLKYRYNRRTPTKLKPEDTLTTRDKLLMTLIRLRRGVPERDLGKVFKIEASSVSYIVYAWIRFVSLHFNQLSGKMFLSARAQNDSKPECFKRFPNLRVVIDSTEFKIQKPSHFQQQSNTYSVYKSSNTVKYLIGISCFGGLSFISEGYEGSISDRKLLILSGFLDHLESDDAVMSDRGFDIQDILNEKEVELIMPPFLGNRDKFTPREILLAAAITKARTHVERFIGKMRENRLIRQPIPNTMLAIISDLVQVCAYLVNFNEPFINFD